MSETAIPTAIPSALGASIRDESHARILPALASAEWRWLAIVTALILLMTQVPPTVQRLYGRTDRVHDGTYWYHTDFSAYRNAMQEGETSDSWLIHNPASAEAHHPALMFPLYVTIGKAAKATGLPLLALFAAVETVTRLLLPATLYLFMATYLKRVRDRRLAFVLAAFSGGLTLFLVPLLESFGIEPTLGGQPSVQVVTFGLFFTAPHLGLGLIMTLTAMMSFGAACRGSLRALAVLALSVIALALLHPFNLPTVITTFGVYALARIVTARRLVFAPILACAVAGLAGVPLLLYNFVTFTLDPFWSKTHGEANTLPSPRPWELPMDYGMVFILAVVGAVALIAEYRRPHRTLSDASADTEAPASALVVDPGVLIAWMATGLLWMYIPLAYQHRLAFGLQPAMAVLAAVGWHPTHRSLREALTRVPTIRRSTARALTTSALMVLALSLPATIFVALAFSASTNAPIHLYTLDSDTYAVGQWLAAHTGPNDVVLGAVNTGEVLSGFLPGRVVIARKAGTIDFPEKLEEIEKLYRGELSKDAATAFLREQRVSFLIVGPEERELGGSDPGMQLGLTVADRVGSAVAYQVGPAIPLPR